MVRAYFRILRRFRRQDRGAVLLIFTIFVVPLLLVVAVATDFAQLLVVKRQLTGGADAAALTLGMLPSLTDAEADVKAEAYIRAHYPGKIGTLKSFTVQRNGGTVDVSATAEMQTTFLRVAGYDKLTITVNSEATRAVNSLEVVMVLDNSGSMDQQAGGGKTKLEALKDAASTLADTLMGAGATSANVKVGLVPFMGAVNPGVPRGNWRLDESDPTALNYENITGLPAGTSLLKLFDDMHSHNPAVSWRGCVRARAEPFDVLDTPPSLLNKNTLFTPYFAPDEPGGEPDWANPDDILLPKHPFKNNYIGGPLGDAMTDITKYAVQDSLYTDRMGPNARCPAGRIMPLTNIKADIKAAINAMQAVGVTVIPEGMAWGWRVLSPGEPFTQGVPY
jgi:Flp pilus assembly protein TadG